MGAEATNPRLATIAFSRKFVFAPYTSTVITSGASTFEFKLPSEALVDAAGAEQGRFVRTEIVSSLAGRFVYIFVTEASFTKLVAELKAEAERSEEDRDRVLAQFLQLPSSGGKNPLRLMYRVIGKDSLEFAFPGGARDAADASQYPSFLAEPFAAEFGVDSRLRYFAIGTPQPLSGTALREVEEAGLDGLPELDLFAGSFEVIDPSDSPEARYILPVLDPFWVAQGLTQKYHLACDLYLAHTTKFEQPRLPTSQGASSEEILDGRRRLLEKGVADSIQGLRKASSVDGELDLSKLEKFTKNYEDTVEALREAREEAAFQLIRWLESSWMTRAEGWGWKDDDALERVIDQAGVEFFQHADYVNVVGAALTRLSESDTGLAYLSQTAERAKKNKGKHGVLNTIDRFILADSPTTDVVAVGRKSALAVFGAWSAFFEVITAHIAIGTQSSMTVKSETKKVSELKESVQVLWSRASYLFDGDVVQVETPIALKVPVKVDKVFVTVEIDQVRLNALDKTKSIVDKTNVKFDQLQAALAILNIGLTYNAFREALRKENVDASVWSSAFDMTESLVFFGDQLQKIQGLQALRRSLTSTPAGAELISRRLGLLGSVLAVGGSATAALDNYNQHDWNAAAAEAAQGVGAIVTGIGYYLLLTSPQGGPAAGYFLLAGAAVSAVGFVWSIAAKDSPFDKLAKHSSFGNDPAPDIDAPKWALCPNGKFSDWNSKTEDGLKRQLKAAEQLFFSFRAKAETLDRPRPSSSDVGLVLLPSSLRPTSVFHIRYEGSWARSGTRDDIEQTKSGVCLVRLRLEKDVLVPSVEDTSGAFQTQGVVKLDSAQNRLEVQFRPLFNTGDVFDFTCRVRLDVHGDGKAEGEGGSVSVPKNAAGPKSLSVVCFKKGEVITETTSTFVDSDVV